VLWRCWLGGRKGTRPVTNRVVGCWRGHLSGVRCRLAYGPADATATHCLLLHLNPDWFCLLVPAHPGSPVKRVCVSQVTFGVWTYGSVESSHRARHYKKSCDSDCSGDIIRFLRATHIMHSACWRRPGVCLSFRASFYLSHVAVLGQNDWTYHHAFNATSSSSSSSSS